MPGDKQQKMIGGYMAIVMLWFGWISPAGVLLYWDVSSIWGVAQQQITMSMTKRELAAIEPAPDLPARRSGASATAKRRRRREEAFQQEVEQELAQHPRVLLEWSVIGC